MGPQLRIPGKRNYGEQNLEYAFVSLGHQPLPLHHVAKCHTSLYIELLWLYYPSSTLLVNNMFPDYFNGQQPRYVDPLNITAMACPALPLCPLAITEAERGTPDLLKRVRAVFETVGLKYSESLVVRVTGCPNGCARPYMAELGFVGDGPNSYQIWLGGTPNQTTIARSFMDRVKIQELEKVMEPLFYNWKRKRQSKESFGDFTNRTGFEKLKEMVDKWEGIPEASPRYNLKLFVDRETYEAMDVLAKLQDKSADQLAMEVMDNFIASQQNGSE